MTVDLLRDLAVLQSSAWLSCRGPVIGPALYLDRADTQALIAELSRLKEELQGARGFSARFGEGMRRGLNRDNFHCAAANQVIEVLHDSNLNGAKRLAGDTELLSERRGWVGCGPGRRYRSLRKILSSMNSNTDIDLHGSPVAERADR